jgi:hypothetical protein
MSMRINWRKLLTSWGKLLIALTVFYCFVFVLQSIPIVLAEGAGKITCVARRARQNYAVLDNGLELAVGHIWRFLNTGDSIEKRGFSYCYAVNGGRINALPYEAEGLFSGMLPAIVFVFFAATLALMRSAAKS